MSGEPQECGTHGWYFEDECPDCASGISVFSPPDLDPTETPQDLTLLEDTLRRTERSPGSTLLIDFGQAPVRDNPGSPKIEVTGEHCQDAALRFRGKKVAVLNFASGVSPGGGVRFGAQAQEEALCLSSGLLHGLEANLEYYLANRADDAPEFCYDRMIYSRQVPLIRNGALELVDPMLIDVLTYAAPNVWGRKYNGPGLREERPKTTDKGDAPSVFRRRCRQVIRQADFERVEVLILGAWGCGAYGNDPQMVAEAFKEAVYSVSGSIQTVVFAVLGGTIKGRSSIGANNRAVFERILGAA